MLIKEHGYPVPLAKPIPWLIPCTWKMLVFMNTVKLVIRSLLWKAIKVAAYDRWPIPCSQSVYIWTSYQVSYTLQSHVRYIPCPPGLQLFFSRRCLSFTIISFRCYLVRRYHISMQIKQCFFSAKPFQRCIKMQHSCQNKGLRCCV
jgi:hypothetical protein